MQALAKGGQADEQASRTYPAFWSASFHVSQPETGNLWRSGPSSCRKCFTLFQEMWQMKEPVLTFKCFFV